MELTTELTTDRPSAEGWEISLSDNSHIFGIPMRITEGYAGSMTIPILDKNGRSSLEGLEYWVRETMFLENAGIELHLKYGEKGGE